MVRFYKTLKIIILFLVFIYSQDFFSQIGDIPKNKTQKAFSKLDFLSINMPSNSLGEKSENMGFTGIHYNLKINNLIYSGLGLYGAVSGDKGGFFTLGVNFGIKKSLIEQFYIDAGFHFGGGGGAGAPDGGGAFILPHFNIGYNFKHFSINSGWSYINFFDGGKIESNQLNLGIEIPLDYNYTDYNFYEKQFKIEGLKNSDWNIKATKNALTIHWNNLKVIKEANLTNKTIRLLGLEYSYYLHKNWFSLIKVDGAFDGIKAGYMDVFLGGGYHLSINKKRTNILAKLAIGAGGGGGVNTEGGLLFYQDLSLEQKIFNDVFISINKGYLLTPNKSFYTSTFGAGLKYYIEKNGTNTEEKISFTYGKFKGLEFILEQDLYFDAKRDVNLTENLHQIALQVNLYLNKNIYANVKTSFANFGNAGAYAEGLVGLGIKSNTFANNTTEVFVQFLGGAAGGGNISTGQGLIVKPSTGIGYQLSKNLGLRTSAGYVKAKGGKLSSPFISLGLKYGISFLKLKKT